MSNNKLILAFVVIGLLATLTVAPFMAQSRKTFHTFEMSVPEEVEAVPGEELTVEGEILVTGYFWLHNFDLTVEGLPYEYEIEPEWWEHVRILRNWNSEDGLYLEPETFELRIKVPADATGSNIVTITGQEHHSFRQVSNFTYFVLRAAGEPIEPQLTVSDILVPEEITEYEPFQLTYKLNNEGPVDTTATVNIVVPEDWQVDEPSQDITVNKGQSAASAFSIIPTTTAGEVSLEVEYPFGEETIEFTKAGPYLIPTGAVTTTIPEEEGKPLLSQIVGYVTSVLESMTEKFEAIGGPYTAAIIMGIIFVLFIIIVWLILDIVKFTTTERKKPEETKEKGKEKPKAKTKTTKVSDIASETMPDIETISGADTETVSNEFEVRVREIKEGF